MLNDVMICFIRNDGDPNLGMAAMVIGSLANILLDYIFIFSFGLGLFGAALATGVAPVIRDLPDFDPLDETFSYIEV